MPEILRLTKNIRSLTIESANLHDTPLHRQRIWWAVLQGQLAAMFWKACQRQDIYVTANPLRQLTQLTLHWSGDGNRLWRCRGHYSAVFALPRLEDLTVSCAIIHDDAIDSVAHFPKTPL